MHSPNLFMDLSKLPHGFVELVLSFHALCQTKKLKISNIVEAFALNKSS